jgi:hypothetical protein
MRNSSFAVKLIAAAALVLTILVFGPVSSQAVEVFTDGQNTATGIKDLECGEDVFIDVTFVFDVGTAVYGPPPGEFPYEGLNGATREEGTYALGVCIQNGLNAWSEAITRVGPESLNHFLIAAGADAEEPGTPYFYGAFASAYYENPPDDGGPQRPKDTWVPADTWSFHLDIQLDGNWPPIDLDGHPLPFGFMPPLRTDVTYSWAKIEEAADSPAPPNVDIGGNVAANGGVTGLTGSGLVLQNNGGDDLDITDNGDFTFGVQVPAGSSYAVTVKTPPSNPAQKCTVARGSDTAPSEGVDDVLVTCTDPPVSRTAFLPAVYLLLLLND